MQGTLYRNITNNFIYRYRCKEASTQNYTAFEDLRKRINMKQRSDQSLT